MGDFYNRYDDDRLYFYEEVAEYLITPRVLLEWHPFVAELCIIWRLGFLVGSMTVQIVPIAAVWFILWLSGWITKYRNRNNAIVSWGVWIAVIIIYLVVGSINRHEIHSVSVLVIGFLVSMWMNRSYKKHFIGLAVVLAAYGTCVYVGIKSELDKYGHIIFYKLRRVYMWLHPEKFAGTEGYDFYEMKETLKKAGFFGNGWLHTENSSKIAGIESDPILIAVADQFGWIGCLILCGLITFLCYQLFMIAKELWLKQNVFGGTFTFCVFIQLSFLFLHNILKCLQMIPYTAGPLPFISYCPGQAYLFFVELGIIISILRKEQSNCTKQENSVEIA